MQSAKSNQNKMEESSPFLTKLLPHRLRKDSYNSLPESEAIPIKNEEPIEKAHRGLLRQCLLYISLSIAFTFLSSVMLVFVTQYTSNGILSHSMREKHTAVEYKYVANYNPLIAPSSPQSCGSSATEARARGCKFDAISFTWLMPGCFDGELTAAFLSEHDWAWSVDANGTERISREMVVRGDIDKGWVTWEYHLTHCLYTWKKLIRHLERGSVMDFYVTSANHTRHCAGLLSAREKVPLGEWNSEFFVQYPLCGKLEN